MQTGHYPQMPSWTRLIFVMHLLSFDVLSLCVSTLCLVPNPLWGQQIFKAFPRIVTSILFLVSHMVIGIIWMFIKCLFSYELLVQLSSRHQFKKAIDRSLLPIFTNLKLLILSLSHFQKDLKNEEHLLSPKRQKDIEVK